MLDLTDTTFDQEILKSDKPVMVDFWAPWCLPCKIIAPVVDELAKEYAGKIKIGKVNVDENSEAAARYGVMSIPTIYIFKNGQPVKSIVGAQSKENFKRAIDEVLAA